jgi:hypothetical protein
MNALETWRTQALKSAEEKNPAAPSHLERSELLYWWFGSHFHAHSEHDMHLYWELRYDGAKRAWIVFGALISMSRGGASPGVQPIMVEKLRDATRGAQHILFDIPSVYPPLAYNCLLDLDAPPNGQQYEMKRIRVTVSKVPYTDPQAVNWRWLPAPLARAKNVLTRIDENLSCAGPDTIEGTMADLPCPDCNGEGSTMTFAIPKADWESGLTGYALYSCNTLNAVVACSACGGSGVSYHAWYLDEKPELRATAVALVKGSGRVRARRLPCRGTLNNG